MRSLAVISSVFLIAFSAFAAARTQGVQNLSQDIPVSYFIEAELDTTAKTLTGGQKIRFLNPTDKEISRLTLHLFPNAFKDTLTTMARSGTRMKSNIMENPTVLECDSIMVNGYPPDSILLDETLLHIYLKDELKPNKKLDLSFNFKLVVSRAILRMGFDSNGNYLFAHWHAILAGYQKNEPVLFQYGYDGEFFSNFANYEVNLAVPEGFTLISTANIRGPDSTANGKAYYSLASKRIIDFAFACGPAWQNETYYYNNVAINLLYLPANKEMLPRLKENINGSLKYFSEMLYPYPYLGLSFVDFNPGAGGMELPAMAVMSFDEGAFRKNDIASTVIHETAHQWFYATIATNEYDEPWLDEGIATYLTERAMMDILGETTIYDFYGLKISFFDIAGIAPRLTAVLDPLASSSDDYYTDHYFFNVYGRAAATLKTLEGVLGTERFNKALQEFAVQYKFGHPDGTDFKNSFERSAGQNLDWFFDSYILGTSRVDYEISSLSSTKTDSLFTTRVEVRRNYDGRLPQMVAVRFADGSTQSQSWDGIDKYRQFKFDYKYQAVWAAIDTANQYLIDENYANNSVKINPENGVSVALTSLLALLVQIVMIFIGLF